MGCELSRLGLPSTHSGPNVITPPYSSITQILHSMSVFACMFHISSIRSLDNVAVGLAVVDAIRSKETERTCGCETST